jgi:hypothetical protein
LLRRNQGTVYYGPYNAVLLFFGLLFSLIFILFRWSAVCCVKDDVQ